MDLHDWLIETTAADIMVREVITLNCQEPLSAAADLFLREQVSGVPVVGSDGRCCGVLSVIDVISADQTVAREIQKVADSSLFHTSLALPASIYRDKIAEVRDKVAPSCRTTCRAFHDHRSG